jgi:uncharacterized protein YcbX
VKIQSLSVYPIKSLRGIALDRAVLCPTGFLHDRSMMLVDRQRRFISQREFPQLANIAVNAVNEGYFEIVFPTNDRQIIPYKFDGPAYGAAVWNDYVNVIASNDDISQLFSEFLHQHVELVRMDFSMPRLDSTRVTQQSLTDSCPILVTTTKSIEVLESAIATSVDPRRFRGNIHVLSEEQENEWQRFFIRDLKFEAIKICSRCVIINNDPFTGVRNHDLLRSLVVSSGDQKKARFGLYCFGPREGEIAVGDELRLIE